MLMTQEEVYLLFTDLDYQARLAAALDCVPSCRAVCAPGPSEVLSLDSGIVVVDPPHLDKVQSLVAPQRLILIANKTFATMTRAWEARLHLFLDEREPLELVVLAVQALQLRLSTQRAERLTRALLNTLPRAGLIRAANPASYPPLGFPTISPVDFAYT